MLPRFPHERYEVVTCPSSTPSERWLEELQPDMVLLAAPTDQRQLLRACERARGLTERPVVVLSERREELLVARALALGVDEYLTLPIGDHELVARIEALLRRVHRYAGTKDIQQIGGITLSSSDQAVTYQGRKIFLSPIQFRLLSCLASAPGKVLTHQTLMSRVWGAEYVDARHYLRLYVRYLREKLEDDPTNPKMILSEWGVGYRFQPPSDR